MVVIDFTITYQGHPIILKWLHSIRTAVNAVLQTPSYRANAQKIRESFLRCGGAKAAVDRILSVADRK